MIKINKNIKIANTLPGHLYNSEEFLRKELANKYKDMGKKIDGFE